MFLLLLYVGGALGISFLCSVLEATLLSARIVELADRRNAGDRGATLLLALKQDRVDDAISAILILNTIAHTVGATMAGNQAGKVFADARIGLFSLVGVFTAVFTLLVLVGTEIIPKTLGTLYASRLVGPVAHTTNALIWLLRPVLLLTRLLTRLVGAGGRHKATVSRGELRTMVAMATRDGTIEHHDSRVVSNVLQFHEIKVEDVMTPRTVIAMLPVTTTIEAFLANDSSRVYSRLPIYDGQHDNVVGYVLQREVFAAAADGMARDTPIANFRRQALYIPEGQAVGRVLRRLIEQREHMALVTDEYGGISGLVTLEDLVETTLGVEILDESDRVADLRAEAKKLREQRLASLARWRRGVEDSDEEKEKQDDATESGSATTDAKGG